MPYFDEPVGRVKIQTSKNAQRYYTKKRLIRHIYIYIHTYNNNNNKAAYTVKQCSIHISVELNHRKVRLMKPTHDSPLLRVSCLRTHQTVFNEENSYHLVYIQACEKSCCYLHNYNGRE